MRLLSRIKRKLFGRSITSLRLKKTEPVSHLFGFDRGTPIDRYYINKFLGDNSKYIHGNILEIADSNYSRKFSKGGECNYYVLTFDNPPNSEELIKGDLTKEETLPEGLIDCFICTQTFNFIYDVKAAIKGSYKLLKEGGVLLATVGGLSQISRYDMDRWGDYWRFTDLSIKKLMEEVFPKGNVEVIIYGNALSATAFVQGLALEDLKDNSMLDVRDDDYQVTIGVIARK